MTSKALQELVRKHLHDGTPEGEEIDYKREVPDDIGKDLAAMANGKGGLIMIGVADQDGKPGGLVALPSVDNAETSLQHKAKDTVSPPVALKVQRVRQAGTELLIIQVPPSRIAHGYWQNGKLFFTIRQGTVTIPMPKAQYDARLGILTKAPMSSRKPARRYKEDIINGLHWEWSYDATGKMQDLTPHCTRCTTRVAIRDDLNPPRDRTAQRGLSFFCPTCNRGSQMVNVLTKASLIDDHVIPKIEKVTRSKEWDRVAARLKHDERSL